MKSPNPIFYNGGSKKLFARCIGEKASLRLLRISVQCFQEVISAPDCSSSISFSCFPLASVSLARLRLLFSDRWKTKARPLKARKKDNHTYLGRAFLVSDQNRTLYDQVKNERFSAIYYSTVIMQLKFRVEL